MARMIPTFKKYLGKIVPRKAPKAVENLEWISYIISYKAENEA